MTGDNRRFQYFAFGVNRYFERSRAFHVSLPGQFGINNRLLMNKPLKPVLLTYPDCVARWRRITGLWIRVSRRRLEHVCNLKAWDRGSGLGRPLVSPAFHQIQQPP